MTEPVYIQKVFPSGASKVYKWADDNWYCYARMGGKPDKWVRLGGINRELFVALNQAIDKGSSTQVYLPFAAKLVVELQKITEEAAMILFERVG